MQRLAEEESIETRSINSMQQNHLSVSNKPSQCRLIFQCEICNEHMTRTEIRDHVKSHSLDAIKNHCVTRVGDTKKQRTQADHSIPLIKIEDDEIQLPLPEVRSLPDSLLQYSSAANGPQQVNPFYRSHLVSYPPSLNTTNPMLAMMGQYGNSGSDPAYFLYNPQLQPQSLNMGAGGLGPQFPSQFHLSMYPFLNPTSIFFQHQHQQFQQQNFTQQQSPNDRIIQAQFFQQQARNIPEKISITKTSASFETVFSPVGGKDNWQHCPSPESEQIRPKSPLIFSSEPPSPVPTSETVIKISDTPDTNHTRSRKRKHGNETPPPSPTPSASPSPATDSLDLVYDPEIGQEHDQEQQESFASDESMRPQQTVIREIAYGCDLCDSAFSSTIELVAHVNGNHKVLTIQCSRCAKKFYNNRAKTIHESVVHDIIKPNRKRKVATNHDKVQNDPDHIPQAQSHPTSKTLNMKKSEKIQKPGSLNCRTKGPVKTKLPTPNPYIAVMDCVRSSPASSTSSYAPRVDGVRDRKSPSHGNKAEENHIAPRVTPDLNIPKKKSAKCIEKAVLDKNTPFPDTTTAINIVSRVVTEGDAIAAAAAFLLLTCEYCEREFRDKKGLKLHAKFCRIRFLHEQTDIAKLLPKK